MRVVRNISYLLLRMASMEEQAAAVLAPEGGEPLAPPKPRKPHEKGIVFRDFDVSIEHVILFNSKYHFCFTHASHLSLNMAKLQAG